jgi:uncharacterized membrane protein YraQ (UPF0718 family)
MGERSGNLIRTRRAVSFVNIVAVVLVVELYLVTTNSDFVLRSHRNEAHVGELLLFALFCGLAAYATVEIVKRFFDLRGILQRRETMDWVTRRCRSARTAIEAQTELLDAMGLAAADGAEERRIFNLPAEQLSAQISAAADLALMPRTLISNRFRLLAAALAGGVTGKDTVGPRTDEPAGSEPVFADWVKDEAVLAQRVRAGIDQLQIALGDLWRTAVQGAAIWIAGLFGIALIQSNAFTHVAGGVYMVSSMVLGGPIAWVISDLAAAAEHAR